jgi:hypothetical protein
MAFAPALIDGTRANLDAWARDCQRALSRVNSMDSPQQHIVDALSDHQPGRLPPTRLRIQIVLDGDVSHFDTETLTRIINEARKKTGDAQLTVTSITSGSILLELDVSAEAAAMLKKLFDNGDLRSIGGITILAIKQPAAKLLAQEADAMSQSREVALADFFVSAFASDELRDFVRSFSDGTRLDAALPGASVSLDHLASEAVDVLLRHNLICATFFERLELERPRRCEEIRRIRRLFQDVATAGLASSP